MTDSANSSDGFSGVVMGKAAGAALAGEGARESPTGTPKIDGGALVARVLQSQGVKYLLAVNGGHTWPILAALRGLLRPLQHLSTSVRSTGGYLTPSVVMSRSAYSAATSGGGFAAPA